MRAGRLTRHRAARPTASARLGNKAGRLVEAEAIGVDVPHFLVIEAGQSPPPTLPKHLAAAPAVAVRSAFDVEDSPTGSQAGRFLTELDVPTEPAAIAASVERVRASVDHETALAGGHVVVMAMVRPQWAGVAFTEPGFEDDLVNATAGLADGLVGGRTTGEAFPLPRLHHRFDRVTAGRPAWQRRLAQLLRRVRRAFGDLGWDLEWADDGTTCWLLQLRPITAPPLRNEVFTLANHKEILPDLPSTFMTSRIEASSQRLLDFYRSIDPTLPVGRPFVETFDGRPYLNLTMLTDLMRALGLPSALVTESYGGRPDVRTGLRLDRLVVKAPTLARIGLAQLTAVPRAHRRARELRQLGESAHQRSDFAGTIALFGELYEGLVQEMGALASSLAPLVALLRRTGTLDEHLATHRTAAAEMIDDLERVRSGQLDLDRWMELHGHRGQYESDIARPRFVEDPEPILRAVASDGSIRGPVAVTLRGRFSQPLWWLVRAPMAAREHLRSEAMRGFLAVRRRLLELAADAVAGGLLPGTEDLWLLRVEEAATLDTGASFEAGDLESRRRHRAELAGISVPDQRSRQGIVPAVGSGHRTSFDGVPLVRGRVRGRALLAAEPPSTLPAGFRPSDTILVARSVDAGWVPVFEQVAAVAVEIGGDLSHGSIILRELGVPAVTNLGEVRRYLSPGDLVELDGSTGRLRRL